MYKCNECGYVFEKPIESREYHGLDYGYESFYVCPNCGETDYNEDHYCTICGEKHFGENDWCEWCLADAIGKLKVMFEEYEAQTEDLIDLFTEALEAIYLEERRKKR